MSDVSDQIDVRDLESVRQAAKRRANPTVLLGDDWLSPHSDADSELIEKRRRRNWLSLRNSPIARKIITFNLIAVILLVSGVLFLNPSRDNLAFQRRNTRWKVFPATIS